MDNRHDVNEDITNDNVASDNFCRGMKKLKMLVGWM